MIYELAEGQLYQSQSGRVFRVLKLARHGQDCSIAMVVYENLEPTDDAPALTTWVMVESMFLQRFREVI